MWKRMRTRIWKNKRASETAHPKSLIYPSRALLTSTCTDQKSTLTKRYNLEIQRTRTSWILIHKFPANLIKKVLISEVVKITFSRGACQMHLLRLMTSCSTSSSNNSKRTMYHLLIEQWDSLSIQISVSLLILITRNRVKVLIWTKRNSLSALLWPSCSREATSIWWTRTKLLKSFSTKLRNSTSYSRIIMIGRSYSFLIPGWKPVVQIRALVGRSR